MLRLLRPSPIRLRIAQTSHTQILKYAANMSTAAQPVSTTAQPREAPALDLKEAAKASGSLDTNTSKSAAASGSKKSKDGSNAKKAKKGGVEGELTGSMASLELDPPAPYLAQRIEMFERLKKEHDDYVASQPRTEITITLPDGNTKTGQSWETRPLDIAAEIAKSLPDKIVIAKVDGELWDLERPLEKSCKLELLDFTTDEGKQVFWHSSAHVLGEAAERHYGCHLCFGPPTDEGYFYDMAIPENGTVVPADYAPMETLCKSIVKEKQPFERLSMKKEDLLKMFEYNKYKLHFINQRVPDGTSSTVYRCGSMVDLCRGPHVPHTGRIKSMAILKHASSYFLGDAANDSLQRVYGISFPDDKQMKEHKKWMEEAALRDHRKIGRDQELFFFNEISPGSCFWLPHGTRIYNALLDMIKSEYRKRGYTEVISPNMYNSSLWKKSGHWAHYKDDMFVIPVDKEEFGLKPMNCPGHCIMFNSRDRSYRELPMRYADFGVLHRNEASGALTGLTRVRRFQQDDAHIFCTVDQIGEEIKGCLNFMASVYKLFNISYRIALSTRPGKKEDRVGSDELWDRAESILRDALEEFSPGEWKVKEGDGAFYGPKLDIVLQDATRRERQCATIQLDFNLPERFDLAYRTSDSSTEDASNRLRPVMIHRAILGSIERFVAMLAEHTAGKWPFWISPRQVIVLPVSKPFKQYADEVAQKLWEAGIYAEADMSDNTLPKRIRTAEISQYNFILVVGAEEQESRSVNVRNRDDVGTKGKSATVPLDDIVKQMTALKESRRYENHL